MEQARPSSYYAGIRARELKIPIDNNPHSMGGSSLDFNQWQQGWYDADRDMRTGRAVIAHSVGVARVERRWAIHWSDGATHPVNATDILGALMAGMRAEPGKEIVRVSLLAT
jgi:hypothetical protein